MAIVAIALCAAMILAFSAPIIATWTGYSNVNITSSTATVTFTTSVTLLATNAATSYINVDGGSYNSANIGAGVLLSVVGGTPATNSTVNVSASGFLPGDYAIFEVTIKNTSPATTLGFTNYQQNDEFVGTGTPGSAAAALAGTGPDPFTNASGTFWTFPLVTDLTQPLGDRQMGGNTVPVNVPYWIPGTWTITPVSGTGFDAVSTPVPATSGELPQAPIGDQTLANMDTQFLVYLNNEAVEGCANTWCQNNVFLGGTLPATLAPGATFTYYIYTGLGIDTAYGIPAALYQVSIPLTALP